ncbi:hypothetical protein [Marinobacter sp. VGCF2001]|uniref:hypothetical protein n=1 Tax=Marinobacter sp. VGCF2001 TaxID=3417189 RepID=UPI003CEC41A3
MAAVSSDFSSGGVNYVNLDSASYDIMGPYHETGSDIAVVGGQGFHYLLGRYNLDNISKIDMANYAQKTWDEFSVIPEGEQNTGNPYNLITVNDQKAYLIRYNSDKISIVNPSARNEAEFFTDTPPLKLSDYVPASSAGQVPQISSAALADNKLFVTLQRLDENYEPNNTGYVAVFDVSTNEEIDTGKGADDNLKGIPLEGTNPADIQYHEGIGLVVKNLGTNFSTYGNGTSVDIIDSNYNVTSMIQPTADKGQIKDLVIISATEGYLINLTDYQNTAVQRFDPSVGRDSFKTIADLSKGDFRDIELSPKGNLWVADANTASPGIRILRPSDDTQIKFVDSPRGLLPNDIAFVTE